MKKINESFNYKLTKIFINNNRLTIMCLIVVILIGTVATLSMKTTGFPSPEIKLALVNTTYIGASSQIVEKDITEPLEGVIKSIDGVKSYTSNSNNNESTISVNIDENANSDNVRNKIDTAVKSVVLPVGADSPKVIVPSISNPDFYISIAGNNLSQIYKVYSQVKKDLSQIPQTASIVSNLDLKQKLVVSIDTNKIKNLGINIDTIRSKLQSIGESIPAVSNVTLDSENKSILTSVSGSTIDDIKNIEFISANGKYKLDDISKIDIQYIFDNNSISEFGFNTNNQGHTLTAVNFTIKTAKNTDLSAYTKTIHDKFNTYDNTVFVKNNNFTFLDTTKIYIVEALNQNDSNQNQVNEVTSGLIGGPLNIDGPAKNLGWFLGGIQLVFLVMIAFVSIRAAFVAAAAIPLSLIFSNIFLYLTGNSLNTLVLFSLVLVIGLVVDPTLVILESIQRKIDSGLKGKEASLAAVRDVGNGLFIAALTNIIVFLPFGVISGILGQIFSYIPLTIIPAVIGSYVVPIIFLAWIGGLFLKSKKNKSKSEEDNLWRIAKWLKRANYKILNSSRWLRIFIILIAFLIPLIIAIIYIGNGSIKQVQFASSDDSKYIVLAADIKSSIKKEFLNKYTHEIIETISSNNNVATIFSESKGFNYFILLKDVSFRSLKAQAIADSFNTQLQDKYKDAFFDIKASIVQNGPPSSDYQISVSVKTDDLSKLQLASKDIGMTLLNVCQINKTFSIDVACVDGKKIITKIDDGYTNRENKVIEVLLDRNKLEQKQLIIPNAPLSILVNTQIKSLFEVDDGKKLSSIQNNGDNTEIVLSKESDNPKTINDIKNLIVYSKNLDTIKLSDIATIREINSKSSIIRVKGETIGTILARLDKSEDDQTTIAQVTQLVTNYYSNNDYLRTKGLGLEKNSIGQYSEGEAASFVKSFTELFTALLLAIVFTYIVLAVFFKSFTQPLVILFTIPLTFIGIFPALSTFTGGQFGFLEIIGMIILIGIVENVAIFLIDAARQKIEHDGWEEKRAISYASAIRFRPVILTKFTAIASLAPLAIFSVFYRSISVVIMFGLLTSGITSLFTTPILFIFFKWLSREYLAMKWWNKILFFIFFPIYIVGLSLSSELRTYNKKKINLKGKNIFQVFFSALKLIWYKIILFVPYLIYIIGRTVRLWK